MNRVAVSSNPGSEFHAFLFAALGEDRNGLPLSVLSALARMDLDPWEEAAVLARLPDESMANKVIALFRTVPDETLSDQDRDTMAKRLCALLPRPETAHIKANAASLPADDATHSKLGIFLFSLFMIALMTTQFVMARMQPPKQGTPSTATTIIAKPAPAVLAPSGQ